MDCMSLRQTARKLGISHAQVIVLERRALGKLMLGLGLYTYDELPWRIRKFFRRPARCNTTRCERSPR